MKKLILLFVSLLLLNCGMSSNQSEPISNNFLNGKINVYCTQDLYNATSKWVQEFCFINPDSKIEIINVSEATIKKTANTGGSLRFISNEVYSSMKEESVWKIEIGRDVVVPIINSKNPFLSEINQQGISPQKLAKIFDNSEKIQWGMLLKNGENAPVHYYVTNNRSINTEVENFLNLNQTIPVGIKVANEKELISSIQKDPYSIGFCKMTNLKDYTNQGMLENVKLLPIDRNENGKIDFTENIYTDLNVLSRAVWIGKYPKELVNSIYAVSSVKPKNDLELAFLSWVLTDGQQFLNTSGYSELVFSERQQKLDALTANEVITSTSNNDYVNAKILIGFLFAFLAIALVSTVSVQRSKKKATVQNASTIYPLVFNENSLIVPKGLYFDKTHTWAYMEKNGSVRIGIDDFLQHITGALTRIKMKNTETKIKKGDQLLSIIHNGKQLHINAPISGIIKAQNELLVNDSSLINSSPYSDGWVYMIEPSNWLREIRFLIMEKKYKEWLKNEFSRLKDFIAVTVKPNTPEYAYNLLQDGGEIKDGILAELGPEVWEDFQSNFIDKPI